MNVKEIKELVDHVARRGVASLEVEHAGFRIRIEGARGAPAFAARPPGWASEPEPAPALSTGPAAAVATTAPPVPGPARPAVDEGVQVVTSPIVGTFYRAPNPDAEPFVKAGDVVEKGKVLCIVEAMKLMNEIEADVSGTVVEVFPQNGQPVEYGERLVAIRVK